MIMQKIDSRISVGSPSDSAQSFESVLIDKVKELNPGFAGLSAIGRKSDLIGYFVKDWNSFSKANTSFSPDDIVYCKAHYLFLHKKGSYSELIENAKQRIAEYLNKYGYLPKVIAIEGEGVIAVEDNVKSIENVLEVFTNILKISFLSENFGGPKFMTKEQIEFIDNWEVENYRRKMAKS